MFEIGEQGTILRIPGHHILSAHDILETLPMLKCAKGMVQKEHGHTLLGQLQIDGRILQRHIWNKIIKDQQVIEIDLVGTKHIQSQGLGYGIEGDTLQRPEHFKEFGGIITVASHYQ
jgi:hypothetical protein